MRARELKLWQNVHPRHMSQVTCHVSCVTCYVSCVTCHMSHVTCHVSRVTCHVSHVRWHVSCVRFFSFFLLQSGEAIRWRVCFEEDDKFAADLLVTGSRGLRPKLMPRGRKIFCCTASLTCIRPHIMVTFNIRRRSGRAQFSPWWGPGPWGWESQGGGTGQTWREPLDKHVYKQGLVTRF